MLVGTGCVCGGLHLARRCRCRAATCGHIDCLEVMALSQTTCKMRLHKVVIVIRVMMSNKKELPLGEGGRSLAWALEAASDGD